MVPWLFPLGVLGTVVFISLSNVVGYILVMVWGWVLFPYGAAHIRAHVRTPGALNNGSQFSADEIDYWRTHLP